MDKQTMLQRMLIHPLTAGLDIDSPSTTELRARIIQSKPFLRRIYAEWYDFQLSEAAKAPSGPLLELGSGAGFLHALMPATITSDIIRVRGLGVVLDAQALPFAVGSLSTIVMTNVLHHIPDATLFLREAGRCLKSKGRIAMIEPWLTAWSRFVYKCFHHEPLDDKAGWKIVGRGPLSAANSALPWIIFQRDRVVFQKEFPQLRVDRVSVYMPFRYLLAGGISLRSLMPGFLFPVWAAAEGLLLPLNNYLGMFAKIVLERSDGN
jgi:SAM-dependent methyltransferase